MNTPRTSNTNQPQIRRERRFWNKHFQDSDTVDPKDLLLTPGDLEDPLTPGSEYLGIGRHHAYILDQLGDIENKTVLDIGTGDGFVAVMLALRGACVVSVDLSEAALAMAARRAIASNVADRITFVQGDCAALGLADGCIDGAVGSLVLHHLSLEQSGKELRRVLVPNAKALFLETLASNRLLMLCRRLLVGRLGIPKLGTKDEQPLDRGAIELLRGIFPGGVSVHSPDILFLRLLPFYIRALRTQPIVVATQWGDQVLGRVPWLRALGYYGVIELRN